jgi:glycine betaine/proline transport system permease protein
MGSVREATWGIDLTPLTVALLAVGLAALAAIAALWQGWRAGIVAALVGLVYFYGMTGLPWLVICIVATLVAGQVGGAIVATTMLAALLFPALGGLWGSAMVTLQICAAGVILSFFLGALIGIASALSDRFSAMLRPVWDTLQTMPIFVFLIPAIMVFLVGEFTALVAIVLYAIVPAARYTEHGLRHVSPEIIEAAVSMGTTRFQRLVGVELPLAFPEILLGLNQTVMMAMSMVIVAALAGARGLGQDIMVALTWLDAGNGIIAGLCVAGLAIALDRVIQSWAARKRTELAVR